MRVGDLVIVATLGEIKAYVASPRTPEAEAGLKPDEIKLDLITSIDILTAHKKVGELVTGIEGANKPGFLNRAFSGENHNLKNEIYREAVKSVAEDIDMLIEKYGDKKVFLSVPKHISKDILNSIKNSSKIYRIVEKDLIKTDKNKLPEEFKPEILK
jgi:hypothetical protein